MALVAELAGREESSAAAGLALTGSYVGVIVTPPVFGLLADLTGGYRLPFAALAVLGLVALASAALAVDPALKAARATEEA